MLDLIELEDLTTQEIEELITRSFLEVKYSNNNYPSCQNKEIYKNRKLFNIFFESSRRTRISFYTAADQVGMQVVDIPIASSSVYKGESILDTLINLNEMKPDIMVIRNSSERLSIKKITKIMDSITDKRCPIINAGDTTESHPTQALLDVLTIALHKAEVKQDPVTEKLENDPSPKIRDAMKTMNVGIHRPPEKIDYQWDKLKVTIICMDLNYNRSFKSLYQLLKRLKCKVNVITHQDSQYDNKIPTFVDKEDVMSNISNNMQEGLRNTDVIYVTRFQKERRDKHLIVEHFLQGKSTKHRFDGYVKEMTKYLKLDKDSLKHAKEDVLVMHPGPFGFEIDRKLVYSDKSVVLEQVRNGIAMRRNIIYKILSDNIEGKGSYSINHGEEQHVYEASWD